MTFAEEYAPPPTPPPLLNDTDLEHLAEHGHVPLRLPPHLAAEYAKLDAIIAEFFKHSDEVKQRAYPASQSTELGYYVVENEKEYVTLRSATTDDRADQDLADKKALDAIRSEIEVSAAEVWRQTATLMYRVLIQLSDALEIPHAAWTQVLEDTMTLPPDWAHATPSLLRLFNYEPNSGVAGKHVDNGLLTLCVGTGAGLQVWRQSDDAFAAHAAAAAQTDAPGTWIDAQGPTLLVGTTLRLLSAGRLAAGSHRVVPNARGRRSIVFAWRPCTRHSVQLGPFGGVGAWDMAALWKRITGQRVNVNAKQALRAEQGERMAKRRERAQVRGGGVGGHADGEEGDEDSEGGGPVVMGMA